MRSFLSRKVLYQGFVFLCDSKQSLIRCDFDSNGVYMVVYVIVFVILICYV